MEKKWFFIKEIKNSIPIGVNLAGGSPAYVTHKTEEEISDIVKKIKSIPRYSVEIYELTFLGEQKKRDDLFK